MGIKGVDNLKPDEVEELHPEWPMVRCIECGHIYEIVLIEVDQKEAVQWIEGDCPKCHHPKFNTCVNNFETSSASIFFDKDGVTGFKLSPVKTIDDSTTIKTIDDATTLEIETDSDGYDHVKTELDLYKLSLLKIVDE